MSTAKTFGTEFRRIRRDAGKTLEDVANILNVSIPYVSDVERNQRAPLSGSSIAKVLTAWGRAGEIDGLLNLAVQHRGEVQVQPRGAEQREMLVALERAIDEGLELSDTQKLMEMLKQIRSNKNG